MIGDKVIHSTVYRSEIPAPISSHTVLYEVQKEMIDVTTGEWLSQPIADYLPWNLFSEYKDDTWGKTYIGRL